MTTPRRENQADQSALSAGTPENTDAPLGASAITKEAVLAKNLLEQTVSLQDAIFNSANFSSIATDAHGIIQIFNVGAQRMLGYTAEEVVNISTPVDMHDPQEIVLRAAQLSLEFGTTITPGFEALIFKASRGIEDIYELTKIRKDGSRFPAIVSVTALRDVNASIIGYLLIGTDNTSGKQVEIAKSMLDQRLRDQQFYTRSLIESNIDALMMTDTMGIISDVNQQMVELTGRTRDELIGSPCHKFFTDPDRADIAIKRALAESRVNDYELTVRALNGDETDVSYNAATFYNRDRVVQGVFASARDVTERKRFEQALKETNIELEHASRMKTEFLATMSHELRTPLNAIIGFSEALKDGLMGDMSSSQREYIGDIFTSGHHLLALINDILDLSKVEAGMMDIELEPVNVRSLLEESMLIVRDTAAVHDINLVFKGADDLGVPMLDLRKTKQIIYNLLSNAVKFTPDEGTVTLGAKRVQRSEVGKIAGNWPVHDFPLPKSSINDFLEIRVSDTGIGISAEDVSKLFLAFSQIDSTLARRFEGTGLGLATVKQLVGIQCGTVAVASAPGEGSTFVVWLPVENGQTVALDGPSETTTLLDVVDSSTAPAPHSDSEQRPASVSESASETRIPDESTAKSTPPVTVPSNEENAAVVGATVAASIAAIKEEVVEQEPSGSPDKYIALVIEDDARSAEVLRLLLEAEGFSVIIATTGEEGLAMAPRQHLSLITLDIRLPGMDGWGFLVRLHEFSDLAAVPIVIIAGDADMSLALTHGAAAVLEKPISRVDLQHSLNILGLSPDARRTRRVLVADDDPETVDVIARFLTRPEYAVERAFTKHDAIEMAQRLHPDLVLLNLMMESFSGYEVVLALQNNEQTEHIPILVVTGKVLTQQELAAVDSDPRQPVRVVGTKDFNRTAFLAEVRRALAAGEAAPAELSE